MTLYLELAKKLISCHILIIKNTEAFSKFEINFLIYILRSDNKCFLNSLIITRSDQALEITNLHVLE